MIDNNSAESMQILKETSTLGRLIIKPVDRVLAKELIVANHYSHKWLYEEPTSKTIHAPKS